METLKEEAGRVTENPPPSAGTVRRAAGAVGSWLWWGTVPKMKPGLFLAEISAGMGQRGREGERLRVGYALAILYAGLLVLTGGVAFAAEATGTVSVLGILGNVPADTLSLEWLRTVFGPLPVLSNAGLTSGGGEVGTVVTTILSNLNNATLIVGGFLIIYSVLVAIAETAHEGTPLGKRYSSLWVPIRLPFGIAMLTPVTSGGLSLAQFFVLWGAVQGSNFAELAWAKAIDSIGQPSTPISAIEIPTPEATIRQVLRGTSCVLVLKGNGLAADVFTETKTSTVKQPGGLFSSATETTTSETVMRWGYGSGASVNDACGTLSYTSSIEIKENESSDKKIRMTVAYNLQKAAINAQTEAISEMIPEVSALAPKAIAATVSAPNEAGPPISAGEILSIVNTYKGKYLGKLSSAISTADKDHQTQWKDEAKRAGWVFGSVWFQTFLAEQGNLIALASKSPGIVTPASYRGIDNFTLETIKRAQDSIDISMAGVIRNKSAPAPDIVARSTQSLEDRIKYNSATAITESELESRIVGAITGGLTDVMRSMFADTTNPFSSMGTVGRVMNNAAAVLSLAVPPLASLPMIGNTILAFMPTIASFADKMFLAGSILSIGVPLVPVLMFTFGVVGWVLAVCEGVAGATLWALAHLTLEGDGIEGSRGGTGWTLLLNIALRPVLMVAGLMIAVALLVPINKYVGGALVAVSRTIVPDSIAAIATLASWCIAYALVMVASVYSVCAAINQLPNGVVNWIGQRIGDTTASMTAEKAVGVVAGVGGLGSTVAAAGNRKTKEDDKEKKEGGSMTNHIPPSKS